MRSALFHAVKEMLERHWSVQEIAVKLHVDPTVVAEIARQITNLVS